MTTPLQQIENATKSYADARETLTERMGWLQNELEKVRRKHLKGIKRAVRSCGDAHAKLNTLIEENADLFQKPRTKTISGIRIGITKSKGEVVINDNDKTCALIQQKLPEQACYLIRTSSRPIKTALVKLSARELQKIGVEIKQTGDQVSIKPTDSHVDKLVNALLAEVEKTEQTEASNAA